jgi:prepilin-type processing-associated H-X9-DG protein
VKRIATHAVSIVKPSGFTLGELVVASAMLVTLGALLVPALSTANETSKATVCLGNMHQWGLAISLYCEDWNDYIPAEGGIYPPSAMPYAWFNTVPRYVGAPSLIALYAAGKPPTPSTKSIFSCPSATNFPSTVTDASPFYMYGLNGRMDPNGPALFKRSQALSPANTIMFCENAGSVSSTDGKYCRARHSGGSHFVFIDGHAQWIAFQDWCRNGNPGCQSTIASDDPTGLGDWSKSVKYHWFPFRGSPT